MLNIDGYYDGLAAFLDHAVEQGFLPAEQRAALAGRRRRRGAARRLAERRRLSGAAGALYQVYPRSFQDSDGDGVGDLAGVRRRLPYLQWLGVDGVWLSPFYASPMADFGYDVSDHCAVDPLFGTLADFDALAAEAHRLGLQADPRLRPEPHVRPSTRGSASARSCYLWPTRPEQLGQRLRRLGLDAARRPLLLPRLPARAAGPGLAQPGRARGDARRAALLVRARRRRLPDRRAAPADQGRPVARQPAEPGLATATTRYDALLPEFTTDRPEVAGRDPRSCAAVGADALLLGELYLPIERLVAYYASGLDLPANFHLLTHAVDARRHRRADRALRGRAAGRRVAELGARQPRPPARRPPASATGQARAAAMLLLDAARHADALLRRRDRHARRPIARRARPDASSARAGRRPRPGAHADAVGRDAGVQHRRAVAAVRRPRR